MIWLSLLLPTIFFAFSVGSGTCLSLLADSSSNAKLPYTGTTTETTATTPTTTGGGPIVILDRRAFVASSIATATTFVTATGTLVGQPQHANAAYGDSTNIELPNYIEFLIEKNKELDPDSILYKGIDPEILLRRLLDASSRLEEIPTLAENKKWSQVQGILTGPLGTLSQTMNQITKINTNSDVQSNARKVKSDLITIGQAASNKNESQVLSATKQTKIDLESFIKASFE